MGDSRLGGISTTLSAYETLIMRGYDVPAIVMAGGPLAASNSEAIQQHARPGTAVLTLNHALPAMQATDRFVALVCSYRMSQELPLPEISYNSYCLQNTADQPLRAMQTREQLASVLLPTYHVTHFVWPEVRDLS